MIDFDYERHLMNLIDHEVERAAAADPDFATPQARRLYGEELIRALPADLSAAALRGADPASAANRGAHQRLQQRLLTEWRRAHALGRKGPRH